MCATILSCLTSTGLLLISTFLESYNLPTPSCMMTPESVGGGSDIHISFRGKILSQYQLDFSVL